MDAFRARYNVSRETIDRFFEYEALVKKWNPAINLISRSTINHIWPRHIIDSAQIWDQQPKSARFWLDIGTGGGFPGLVIAILAKELKPDMKIGLVESDTRKASFLLKTSVDLGLSPKILINRAEHLTPHSADVVSARALAPLNKLLGLAERHLGDNGICLFSKGENAENELTHARKYWTFTLQKTPSRTDSGGVILRIGEIGRA
ncbi:MAG: 16S rRNA (guanine(527)-N(7))-methyltransferase RsmG [Alphaproteobacteria bacterium]|nr:16S rRNA (guanine(527)-N(7))-methyltransferase RsmG [Alphaproteobacteria bacterium]